VIHPEPEIPLVVRLSLTLGLERDCWYLGVITPFFRRSFRTLTGPQLMTSYPDFSPYIICVCLETPQTCHIVNNPTSIDMIVPVLSTTQATYILPVFCSRFPTEVAGRSSVDITSTVLKLIHRFCEVPSGRSSF
jgi:hypothetical protein